MAITNSEHAVVYVVKVLIVIHYHVGAICFINNTTRVGMDVLIICRNSKDLRLFLNGGLHRLVLRDNINIVD